MCVCVCATVCFECVCMYLYRERITKVQACPGLKTFTPDFRPSWDFLKAQSFLHGAVPRSRREPFSLSPSLSI